MKKVLWIFGFLLLLTSCGSDDDICLGEESTPRLLLKFRNANNQLTRVDTLYVDVDYGKDTLKNVLYSVNVDSVFVPLRIDESPYTDIYFRTRREQVGSKLRVSYDKKSIYVSPACGFKINYENLNGNLLQTSPVQSILPNNTSLTDENSINFLSAFLVFCRLQYFLRPE